MSSFLYNYFFYSKLFLVYFLQLLFLKFPNKFFTVKITNNMCTRNNIFNFFNQKIIFRITWNVTFWKNVFIFLQSFMLTKLDLRSSLLLLLLLLLSKSMYVIYFTSTESILNVLLYLWRT